MMRLAAIIFVFICTLAVPVLAETISVRSGAHSGFTRLVLEFSEPHEWRFGPVAGGLEFRTDAADISFDLADVFSRITGQRIASLSQPGPGRLLFGLGCNCHGDAFVIGANQIVLDIKDGGGAAGAEFSMRLSELPAGRTWGQTTASAADGPATRAPRGLVPELGGVLFAAQARSASSARFLNPPDGPPPAPEDARLPAPLRPAVADTPVLDVPVAAAMPTENAQPPQLASVAPDPSVPPQLATAAPSASVPVTPPMPAAVMPAISVATQNAEPEKPPAKTTPPSTGDTRQGSTLFGSQFAAVIGLPVPGLIAQSDANSDRVAAARDTLVRQFQRAVAQGLLDVPVAQIEVPTARSSEQKVTTASSTPEIRDPGPAARDHVRIETAADRDALDPVARLLQANAEQKCLPAEWFDAVHWGPGQASRVSPDDLRAALVGEFDRPNERAVLALVRRYIFMGFGLEARQVLDIFGLESEESWTLRELAVAVDLTPEVDLPRLAGQIGCKSAAALWSVLSDHELARHPELDKKSLLRTFSALPVHLRNHLGPPLAQSFVISGDPETALTIRNTIDRAPAGSRSALSLIDARLALSEVGVEQATPLLEMVVAEDGPDAALALAELIENHRPPIGKFRRRSGGRIPRHKARRSTANWQVPPTLWRSNTAAQSSASA